MPSIPNLSPLEAGDIACMTCGSILKGKPIMAFNRLEHIRYECNNEATGCNWFSERKVHLQHVTMTGIRADGTAVKVA